MSLLKMVSVGVPPAALESMERRGEISKVSTIPAFSRLGYYPSVYFKDNPHPYRDIAALNDMVKSTQHNNYNHYGYVEVSQLTKRDSWHIFLAYPKVYLENVLGAWLIYFYPSSEYIFLKKNRGKILHWDKLYNFLFSGYVPGLKWRGFNIGGHYFIYAFLLLGLPLLTAFCLRDALKMKSNQSESSTVKRITLLFIVLVILYVSLIGNLLEAGENHRFRFFLSPLFVILMGYVLSKLSFLRSVPAQTLVTCPVKR